MNTLNNPTHWGYGNISVSLFGLTSVLMILVLHILARKTYNTYTMRYRRKHTEFGIVEDLEGGLYRSIALK